MSIIIVCPEFEKLPRGNKARVIKQVEEAMADEKGFVHSATGTTASVAINYCERNGLSYKVTAMAIMPGGFHRYLVERV